MKTHQVCIIFLFCMLGTSVLQAQTYDKLWEQVEQAQQKNLPKTVIKLTDEICQKGKKEKNFPQTLKAYILQMKFKEVMTPDSFYVNLKNLERWAGQTKDPIERAVLHSLITEQYVNYARNNSSALSRRTMISKEEPSKDMREWTLNMFIDKIKSQIHETFVDSTLLLNTSSDIYAPFIVQGETSEYYHHDMYHLLFSRAINELKRMRYFTYSEKDILLEIERFYKNTLSAYKSKEDGTNGYLLIYLDYLDWKRDTDRNYQYYYFKRKCIKQLKDYYQMELDSLIAVFKSSNVCAEVYLAAAQYALQKEQEPSALQFCDEAIRLYPDYHRINAIKNVREGIVVPHLFANIGSGVIFPGKEIDLKTIHKNVKGFIFQLIQSDKLVFEKYHKLPEPETYKYRTTELESFKIPNLGTYVIRVIPDNHEIKEKKQEEIYELDVTRFKVLICDLPDKKIEVMALDAQTGHPISDAQVVLYNDSSEVVGKLTTDAQGKVIFPRKKEYGYLRVWKGEDVAMKKQRISSYSSNSFDNEEDNVSEKIILLTDRSVYRPGQTVYVKGIVYEKAFDSAHVSPEKEYTLILTDANKQEIRKKTVKTNDYGSFATDFTLPSACLNGKFILKVGDKDTNIEIRVENYKRPTFDIVLEKQQDGYQVGDSVKVRGRVQAFNGAVMPNLSVKYTVNRFIYNLGRNVNYASIASGTVKSDVNGAFVIPIRLDGNGDFEEQWSSIAYRYQIEATVTNVAGETQSSVEAIAAGKYSLLLNVDVPEKIIKDQSVNLMFKVDNFANQPVETKGTYRLYREEKYKGNQIEDTPVLTGTFISNRVQKMDWRSLLSGAYLLKVSVKDSLGKEAETEAHTILFSLQEKRPPVYMKTWVYEENTQFDASHPAVFYVGTSEKDAYILLKTRCGNRLLEDKILNLSDTIVRMEYPYHSSYGKGISVNLNFVKDSHENKEHIKITKRLPEHKLVMKWDVFRDKLRPGKEEEWKLTITTPKGKKAEAEMLALMYDASLDKIWNRKQDFHLTYKRKIPSFDWDYNWSYYSSVYCRWERNILPVYNFSYDSFVTRLLDNYQRKETESIMFKGYALQKNTWNTEVIKGQVEKVFDFIGPVLMYPEYMKEYLKSSDKQELIKEPVGLRKNLSETAFFYPQLRTNKKGEIAFSFTMPESLTHWNFRGYSHTKDMMTGTLDGEVTTSKEFMLTPNVPRFVRAGDKTSIAASIVNTTGKMQNGTVTFILFDPVIDKEISVQKQVFTVDVGETIGVKFTFEVDGKQELLGCRMIADSGQFSDGEQQIIPVLSDKVYLTETLPIPIREKEKRTFSLETLFNHQGQTITNKLLTVEYTANPAWYAIQALPSMSLPANDDAISWATSYYANTLAAYVMNSQPRVKSIFDSWRLQEGAKETFLSNLQKNQEMRNVLLSESPWLLEAKTEQQQKERLATLFDLNVLSNNRLTAITKLLELQNSTGGWSWYKGMRNSLQITLYIADLNARLTLLTGEKPTGIVQKMQERAFTYLHQIVLEMYHESMKRQKAGVNQMIVPANILHYLYLIAITGERVPDANKDAYDFFLSKVNNLSSAAPMKYKAYTAIILDKVGRKSEAQKFISSLKQHLTKTDEQGMFFAFNENPYSWGRMQLQAHVEVMEALELVGGNDETVEEMKLWLLKQKQTQQWNSPVATADAVYALLMTGVNLLDNQGDVRIMIANEVMETVSPSKTTVPGLGYIKRSFTQKNVVDSRKIKVEKNDAGIAWGAVYAQYESPINGVKQQEGELNVQKQLYVERIVNNVAQLQPIIGKTVLQVGDKVVSRLSIRLDRAMDFIQLKDQRGACFEPIGSISGYRWNNGFGYYVDIKDASTNFFFDHLGKGVHVLEYSYRVSRTGTYETGLATIQSAYAPEYASHSGAMKVEVK